MLNKSDLISFSLFGTEPKYLAGALRNASDAQRYYPGWTARFYVGRSVPDQVISQLGTSGAEVVHIDQTENWGATLWRFRALADEAAELVLIRDADSRLSRREAEAVGEWIKSGRGFHIMRDHPAHNAPILAGMWGARTAAVRGFRQLLLDPRPVGYRGEDQDFLARHIYPVARKDSLIHDSFFAREISRRRFPSRREGRGFVGEVFDEHERPVAQDRTTLQRAERDYVYRARLMAATFIRSYIRPKTQA